MKEQGGEQGGLPCDLVLLQIAVVCFWIVCGISHVDSEVGGRFVEANGAFYIYTGRDSGAAAGDFMGRNARALCA